jgi:hypothetical protein
MIPRFFSAAFIAIACLPSAHATDVYIVAGQSNGWRMSHLSAAEGKGPAVHYFGMDCVSEPDSSVLKTLPDLGEGTMGYGLAKTLRDASGKEIVFVQYCRCGAPVTATAPNSWLPEGGGLFPKFEKYLQAARAQVEEKGLTWEVKGLIWHQGESDVASDPAAYERELRNVFAKFRSLLGAHLPIAAGHIRDLGEKQKRVNATIDKIAAEDPLLVSVPLDGVSFEPDGKDGQPNVHIDRPGCHLLGAKLASELGSLHLAAEITAVGGKIETGPEGGIVGIDFYNGNNPLKGKGGKNEAVTDAWLAKLEGIKSLQKLSLSNCAITNDGLAHLSGLTGLLDLNLTLTPVSDAGLAHLAGLTELRNLGLASTQCTGSGFTHLKTLKKLENVNFHFTPVNDEGLRAVSAVGVSGRLWLGHTHFTDAGAASFAALKDLKICGIGSQEKSSSGEAVAALVGLKQLHDLSLLDRQADLAGIGHAVKIKTLRRLDLSYAPEADDAALKSIATLPELEEFSIGGSAKITGAGVLALADAPKLKKLTVGKMKGVTPEAVEALKQKRPGLEIVMK